MLNKDQMILRKIDNKFIQIQYKNIDNKKTPSLAVRYTDGTPCDIKSNQPRETIIYYGELNAYEDDRRKKWFTFVF